MGSCVEAVVTIMDANQVTIVIVNTGNNGQANGVQGFNNVYGNNITPWLAGNNLGSNANLLPNVGGLPNQSFFDIIRDALDVSKPFVAPDYTQIGNNGQFQNANLFNGQNFQNTLNQLMALPFFAMLLSMIKPQNSLPSSSSTGNAYLNHLLECEAEEAAEQGESPQASHTPTPAPNPGPVFLPVPGPPFKHETTVQKDIAHTTVDSTHTDSSHTPSTGGPSTTATSTAHQATTPPGTTHAQSTPTTPAKTDSPFSKDEIKAAVQFLEAHADDNRGFMVGHEGYTREDLDKIRDGKFSDVSLPTKALSERQIKALQHTAEVLKANYDKNTSLYDNIGADMDIEAEDLHILANDDSKNPKKFYEKSTQKPSDNNYTEAETRKVLELLKNSADTNRGSFFSVHEGYTRDDLKYIKDGKFSEVGIDTKGLSDREIELLKKVAKGLSLDHEKFRDLSSNWVMDNVDLADSIRASDIDVILNDGTKNQTTKTLFDYVNK
jgi:hypothetical protein